MGKRVVGISCAGLVLACVAVTVAAERPLAVGDRVRIASFGDAKPRVGTILTVEPDRLVLQPERAREPVALPLRAIKRVELSHGRRSRTLRTSLKAAALGAAVLGALAVKPSNDLNVPRATLVGGAFGGLVGALIGSHKHETWEPLSNERLRVGVLVRPAGLGLSATVRF